MKLAWGMTVHVEFRNKVLEIVKRLGWPQFFANWLMACMAFETGRTFSPSIKNAAGSGAVGLIQFMPTTAKGLGTTVAMLEKMTAVEQLEYVYLYFKPYAARIKSLSDMYMAILAPKHIGKPDDTILYNSGLAYKLNAPLDTNKDGGISKGEATAFVLKQLEKGFTEGNVYLLPSPEDTVRVSDPATAGQLIEEIETRLTLLKELV